MKEGYEGSVKFDDFRRFLGVDSCGFRLRRMCDGSTHVRMVRVSNAKIWGEISKVDGGPQFMRKMFSNKLKKLENSIDVLNVQMQDFRVMLKGLDFIFDTSEDVPRKNWQQGASPQVADLDAEDTTSW